MSLTEGRQPANGCKGVLQRGDLWYAHTVKMIADQIIRDCAGNVYVSDHPFAPKTIEKLLLKIAGPSRLNCLGLREPGIWALLSVPTAPCYTAATPGQPWQCIEITRIQCDEHARGTGLFVMFVERLADTCRSLDRCLVMGCVESVRMLTLMRRHSNVWHRLSSDPTSYVYAPSVPHTGGA